MQDTSHIKDIVQILSDVGKRLDFFQGGGGNFSMKTDTSHMIVKASGFAMHEMTEETGFVRVDYFAIRKQILERIQSGQDFFEDEYNSILAKGVFDKENVYRPSIETGFHVFLGPAVFHSHSVYTHVFVCAEDGKAIYKKLFEDFSIPVHWIPYAQPGLSLTQFFARLSRVHDLTKGDHIFFLENHGLVVSANTLEEALHVHDIVHQKIKDTYAFDPFPRFSELKCLPHSFVSTDPFLLKHSGFLKDFFVHVTIPDQVIYGVGGQWSLNEDDNAIFYHTESKKMAIATQEMLLGYVYTRMAQERFGLKTNPLSQENISSLLGMDAERYRQKLLTYKKI